MIRVTPFIITVFVALSAPHALDARAEAEPPQEIADLVEHCATCHGHDGRPINEDAPIIWGQEEYYLYVQMRDIKAGRRADVIMASVVAKLTRDQMRALGKYFSQLPWPNLDFEAEEGDAAVADRMVHTAIANRMMSAGQCPQCHLGNYVGNSRVPRTAGQRASYLKKTMLDFKYKRRKNAADMASLMGVFPDEDIAAMARYLAALQPH